MPKLKGTKQPVFTKHDFLKDLKKASQRIEKPDSIHQCKDFKDRNLFYKRLVLPSVGDTYIRVVVKYRGKLLRDKRGYVINAFSCNGPRKGEVLLWEKGN
ncbi:hypothetical protein ES703_107768 [subsurface metagenome]